MGAWIKCLGIACTFVGSIYIYGRPSPLKARDDPEMIRRRFVSVILSCMVAWIPLALDLRQKENRTRLLSEALGLKFDGLVAACTLPLILTAILFFGPLIHKLVDGELHWPTTGKTFLQFARTFLVAPIAEEFCFRSCMIPLLLGQGTTATTAVLCSPLLFGAAHLHHGWELKCQGYSSAQIVLTIGVMFGYTTVFGWYAAFLFYRTGHLAGAILPHMFCNYMGFPNFHLIPGHPHMILLVVSYLMGIFGFSMLIVAMTDPTFYNPVSAII